MRSAGGLGRKGVAMDTKQIKGDGRENCNQPTVGYFILNLISDDTSENRSVYPLILRVFEHVQARFSR